MKKSTKIIIAVVAALFIIGFIGSKLEKKQPKDEANNTVSASTPDANTPNTPTSKPTPTEPKPVNNWGYNERTDKMSGEISYFASTRSTNKVQFDFPYEGGSTFELLVRKKGKSLDVIVTVSKGQFMRSYSGDKTVRVKFDDDAPSKYTYSMSTTGDSDMIFLASEKKFVDRLKTAKKLMIEAEFYQEGNQIMEFDVEGLKWDK